MGPSQISDTPFQGYVIVFLYSIHISDTQWFSVNYNIYNLYINVAVSCKRYPPSLPYIIYHYCTNVW